MLPDNKEMSMHITSLLPNQVFVFGSNLAGRHGAGAALQARNKFGAQYGVGIGPTGQCYAIPTKGHHLEVLGLLEILVYVEDFLQYAREHPNQQFLVTRIGCGLAGHQEADIAPMFTTAPYNCKLPANWSRP